MADRQNLRMKDERGRIPPLRVSYLGPSLSLSSGRVSFASFAVKLSFASFASLAVRLFRLRLSGTGDVLAPGHFKQESWRSHAREIDPCIDRFRNCPVAGCRAGA